MLSGRVLLPLGVFAISLQIASGVSAQTATTPTTPQQVPTVKEQVEVVATRIPEAPHEVPASVEVTATRSNRPRLISPWPRTKAYSNRRRRAATREA